MISFCLCFSIILITIYIKVVLERKKWSQLVHLSPIRLQTTSQICLISTTMWCELQWRRLATKQLFKWQLLLTTVLKDADGLNNLVHFSGSWQLDKSLKNLSLWHPKHCTQKVIFPIQLVRMHLHALNFVVMMDTNWIFQLMSILLQLKRIHV